MRISVVIVAFGLILAACDTNSSTDSAFASADGKTSRQQVLELESNRILFFDNLNHDPLNQGIIATPTITVAPGPVTLTIDASNYQCGDWTQFLTNSIGGGFEVSIHTAQNGTSVIDGDFLGEPIQGVGTASVTANVSSTNVLDFGVSYAFHSHGGNPPFVTCGAYFEIEGVNGNL